MCTIGDNANRTKDSGKSGTEVFVHVASLPQSYQNEPYQKLWLCVTYILIVLEINKFII